MANTGFIRFRDVTIPENSRIISAVVIFTGFSPNSDINTNILCYFEDADSPAAPTDQTDLDGRSLTSGIDWLNIEEWKDNHVYRTPQLVTILQTVINRDGWASGNDVLFLAVDSSSGSYRLWSAWEFRGGLEKASLLVSWEEPEQIDTPLIEPVEEFQPFVFDCSIRTYPTDASIYYTLDGSTPDETDTLYVAPFSISDDITVKARAFRQYWTPSEVAVRNYTLYELLELSIRENQQYLRYGYQRRVGSFWILYAGFITFKNVVIPAGANITNAFLRVFTENEWEIETDFSVYLKFNKSGNASPPRDAVEYASKLADSTDGTEWPQTDLVPEDTWYDSVDISTELQEVVELPGWISGNAALLFVDTSHYTRHNVPDGTKVRSFFQRISFFSENEPQLHVTWSGGSGVFYTTNYVDDGEYWEYSGY